MAAAATGDNRDSHPTEEGGVGGRPQKVIITLSVSPLILSLAGDVKQYDHAGISDYLICPVKPAKP